MRAPEVQIREEMSVMRVTGGILAFLFLLTAQSMPVAQIGNPMPPPGAVGDPAPEKTVTNKNLERSPNRVRCHPHKGGCLPKPSSR
jgi:hypothetical protein